MRAFHYSNREHKPGDVITAGRDSLTTFIGPKKTFEEALRAGHTNGHAIRSEALYVWENGDFVPPIFDRIPYKYYYEVEIDGADILHRSNLNHYNDGIDAAKDGKPLDEIVAAYWTNADNDDPKPRIEILVTKATVIALLMSK
ncbi:MULTISPECIES: hypothetical protein [unclassified Bradyrhizobium]|uniref:hypothetical protein n=1 Tax=unclassified Bradyrhizobium TaxID=2631580 RepID=UPI002916496A|nr:MULTISPECIES: hypothetical protein [unclassified Bradyrhizobium]